MAETVITGKLVGIALAGGLIPALVWLLFWLREDRVSPEPKGLIAISFFAGMAAIFVALPLEKLVVTTLPMLMDVVTFIAVKFTLTIPNDETIQLILWATIEELAKYATVLFIAFQSRHFDEPIDAVIYMITAALGFAAMENTMYLLKDLSQVSIATAILDSNLRFVGATILHTVSSAFVGIAIAFSFYGRRFWKVLAVFYGLMGASLLHAHFNLSIMSANGTISTLAIFARYWVAIIGIIIIFKWIKILKPHKLLNL